MMKINTLKSIILVLIIMTAFISVNSQSRSGTVCYPTNWWTGMNNNRVLLLIQGFGIGGGTASINYSGVSIIKQYSGSGREGSYLFLDIEISRNAVAGNVPIIINSGNRTSVHNFLLKQRRRSPNFQLLNGSDVIYQILPDRFANGNTSNDNMSGYFEQTDRSNPSGVHGGDILGITKNINYIAQTGVTTVELTPIYESNQLVQSYDKFSPTNHYEIDSRLGTLEDLSLMVSSFQTREMKVILTNILHKVGDQHPFVRNPPLQEWVYKRPDINMVLNTNNVLYADPYASREDLDKHYAFWENFDTPVLNQNIEEVRRYLIQHVIWWIETTGVDGIKIEDIQLNSHTLLRELGEAIKKEYPSLIFIGSPKTDLVVHNHFWKNCFTQNPVFTHVTDFPLYQKYENVFAEYSNSNEALWDLYKIIASDIIYDDPENQVITIGDAHNLTRLFTLAEKDLALFKMYIGFLLTARGVPSFLYGTEVIMEGLATGGHGFVRGDFPGGWANDQISAFNQTTLTPRQREAHLYFLNLLIWRRNNPELMKNKTIQFEPVDDVYAYIRTSKNKILLVIINNNPNSPRRIPPNKFMISAGKFNKVKNVVTGEVSSGLGNLVLNPKSMFIYELTNTE